MGTPHRGSSYATFGKILGKIANNALRPTLTHRISGGIRTHHIKTLENNDGELQSISEAFQTTVLQSALHIISVYETEAHPFTNKAVCTIHLPERLETSSAIDKG